VAPQTPLWKMVLFSRSTVCDATNTLVWKDPYMKMEAERAPDMLVPFYQDTHCHDPEESSLTYRYISEGTFSCL
jgi:5-methylthioribose kinase